MIPKTTMDAIHDLPIFAAARRDDPATSHKAAAAVPAIRGDHPRRIHELRKVGAIERTGREVARGEDEYRNTPGQPR